MNSVVGYVGNPAALPTRALAHGLALRGNDVRVVEERQNHAFVRTLREHGSEPSRHFHEHFAALQHTTWETRTGAPLLEWVTREVALIDVAVVVAGVNDEVCQWIANITRAGLTRVYVDWEPQLLSDANAARLQLANFELILSPAQPEAHVQWMPIALSLAGADADAGLADHVPASRDPLVKPITAAAEFERLVQSAPVRSVG